MNTSLYFVNLTEDEICKILEVVSVPYLMEPLKRQPEKYLAGRQNAQSLSREAVNHIYLQFLMNRDPVLSLYLSDIVVDIIHYFKLSDGFKTLLTSDDPDFVKELSEKIRKRHCPITVDMFMRLLDRKAVQKKAIQPKKENKIFDVEAKTKEPETVKEEVKQEPVPEVPETPVPEAKPEPVNEPEPVKEPEPEPAAKEVKEAKFFDIDDDKEKEIVDKTPEESAESSEKTEAETIEADESDKEDLTPEEEPEVVEAEIVETPEEDASQSMIKELQYQIMSLQMENQTLRDENRNLLFQNEDETEMEVLRRELNGLKEEKERLSQDVQNLSMQNTGLQNDLRNFDEYKKKYNQVLLELRDYKIKYISCQAEIDQLRYTMKNDSKKLKELQNKQRSIYDNESDWMMAMHDLTWYKKQWNLPGDAPLHKIWAHLNREEAKRLAHLLKNYDRLLRTERRKEIDALKEILIVKEAILILLKSDKAMEQAKENNDKQ